MRTTLTLDDDVTALLARVRKERDLSLKDAVNEALRRGLAHMAAPQCPRVRYRTPVVSLGRCFAASLDNVAEALAVAEGDVFR